MIFGENSDTTSTNLHGWEVIEYSSPHFWREPCHLACLVLTKNMLQLSALPMLDQLGLELPLSLNGETANFCLRHLRTGRDCLIYSNREVYLYKVGYLQFSFLKYNPITHSEAISNSSTQQQTISFRSNHTLSFDHS
jgi:hypothetical protein